MYNPKPVPAVSTPDGIGLQKYLERELEAIAKEFSETEALDLRPTHWEPIRPRAGMLVYADGTDWDPGGGEGLYVFNLASVWVKL